MRQLVVLLALCMACAHGRPAATSDPLTPAARAHLRALEQMLAGNPRLAMDFSSVGVQALAPGHDVMVTYAIDPAATKEDIIFYMPARPLVSAGLDPKKLDPVPPKGEMVSGKWYFSSGRVPEPRFNNNEIGSPVVMIAIDIDS
ncbi:MAG TPA: hypothetical protein VNL91_02615 [Thermoanaerobaculia bacterium]|nr:hypothetical protein [Thermoanaerobaculia bacterium]